MNPLISVIVPVYNVEGYLNKCVQSLVTQKYQHLEIILVDDGSTDSSGKLCDELSLTDRRIKVIHKVNGGLSSARNVGLDAATGGYISFIDSDDYVASDFYESLLAVTASDRTIACSHIVRVDENGVITPRKDPHISGGRISSEDFVRELLLHIGDVSVCSKLFKRDLIGSQRFDETKLNEDLLFVIDLLPKIDCIAFTGKVGYYYLCRTDSISSRYGKAIEDMVGNSLLFRRRALNMFPELDKEANRFVLFQHMAYLLLIPDSMQNKDNRLYQSAKKYVRRKFLSEGLFNGFLSLRDKIILCGQIFIPKYLSKYYQKRH